MADVSVRPSEIHGLGVFATRDFAMGETILAVDDSRVVDDEHPLRPELGEYAHHCDYLAGGRVALMPTPERHINSCCDPNTYVRWEDNQRFVVARRAISAGEEITYDYIIDCHGGQVWQCRCGVTRCRGTIVSSYFDLPVDVQREYVPLLSPWFVDEHHDAVQTVRQRLASNDSPPNERLHRSADTGDCSRPRAPPCAPGEPERSRASAPRHEAGAGCAKPG